VSFKENTAQFLPLEAKLHNIFSFIDNNVHNYLHLQVMLLQCLHLKVTLYILPIYIYINTHIFSSFTNNTLQYFLLLQMALNTSFKFRDVAAQILNFTGNTVKVIQFHR
jgi:hypothetical protein